MKGRELANSDLRHTHQGGEGAGSSRGNLGEQGTLGRGVDSSFGTKTRVFPRGEGGTLTIHLKFRKKWKSPPTARGEGAGRELG